MGRPLKCCGECADVFKIDKDTGQIIWSNNLGFEATAIQVFEERIYVATNSYGNSNRDNTDFTSVYDIIVLDLSGNIIEEECLTFLPKPRLRDGVLGDEENKENNDDYQGVIVNEQMISEMFIFKHDGSLYINAVIGYCILQIRDGEIKFITDTRSDDKVIFNKTYLDFSCGETINNVRFDNVHGPGPILVEFGYDYVTFKKPDLPDILDYDSYLPDISLNVLHLVTLSDANIDEIFSYEYVPINMEDSPYVKTTDDLTYNTYTFETPIQGIIFPMIDQSLDRQGSYVDSSKRFDQTICGTSNGYYNDSVLDENGDLEPHARIIFGNDTPVAPTFYIARLNLLNYQYEYILFECVNDFDNLKDMIDKTEINERAIEVTSIAFSDADTQPVFKTYLDKFIFDEPPNLLDGNGNVIIYSTPPNLFPTPDQTFNCTRNIRISTDSISNRGIVNLVIDDSINCGYISDFNEEISSYDFTFSSEDDIFGVEGGIGDEGISLDFNFRYDNRTCPTTILDLSGENTGTIRDLFHPDIYDTWKQYILDNLQCKAKLTSFHFSQISKSYEKDDKIIFNAIMVGNWTTYTDIYNIKPTLSAGTNISRDIYIAFRTDNLIYNPSFELRYEMLIVYDLAGFPKDINGDYYYQGGHYVIYHYYREEFSLNLKFYKGKLSPFGYVHTNTKILISLDKITNKYTVSLDNSDEYDYQDYNITLTSSSHRLSNIDEQDYLPMNLFLQSEETELRDIEYLGVGKIDANQIINTPTIINRQYKYIYRDYEFSERTTFYYPDNLVVPKLVNLDGLKFKNSSFANTKLNDTLYSAYTPNYIEAYNRLITHDDNNEYVAIHSADGRGWSSLNRQAIVQTLTIFDDSLIITLHYDYNFENSNDYTLLISFNGLNLELECSVEDTTTQDIVNFINSNGSNVQVYIDNTLETGIIAIKSDDSLSLSVKESPYETEKYNVFKFTDGELKWKTNIFMPVRPLNDFTNDNREYNAYGNPAESNDSNYSTDALAHILDIHQDDNYLYLATNKRRIISNIPINSNQEGNVSNGRLNLSYCNEIGDFRLKNVIDYPNKKMK